jgi:hypothetical protein
MTILSWFLPHDPSAILNKRGLVKKPDIYKCFYITCTAGRDDKKVKCIDIPELVIVNFIRFFNNMIELKIGFQLIFLKKGPGMIVYLGPGKKRILFVFAGKKLIIAFISATFSSRRGIVNPLVNGKCFRRIYLFLIVSSTEKEYPFRPA